MKKKSGMLRSNYKYNYLLLQQTISTYQIYENTLKYKIEYKNTSFIGFKVTNFQNDQFFKIHNYNFDNILIKIFRSICFWTV